VSNGVDVRLGNAQPGRVYDDNCDYWCQDWDFYCYKRCEGSSWEYASMLFTYNPKDESMTGKEYYSIARSNARAAYCRQQCNMDADCLFYCSNMQFDDTNMRIDIQSGSKPD
jgi:hypothetical protein